MNIWDLCNTIDLLQRDFSLALVTPKERVLEWLREFWKQKGFERYCNYVPEENTVLFIPNIDRFSEVGSLQRFLDEMKPKLLYAELVRFRASAADVGRPLTKETFDEYFDIAIRDSKSIHFISD